MTLPHEIEPDPLGGYTCTRWRRYGHDRLYVSATDADPAHQLGYRDLSVGDDHPSSPGAVETLRVVADAWLAQGRIQSAAQPRESPAPATLSLVGGTTDDPTSAPPSVATARPVEVAVPWRDLSLNHPGESAQVQADAKRAEAPVKTALARVFGVRNPERAWRIGAKGERLVADQLDRLARSDPRWTTLHAVPVGTRGSDIDHVVIGPGGVFTLNTKHHPDAEVWVGGETFMVNGSRVPYVRNARHEAERATTYLTEAVGRPVHVTGLVVLVGCKTPIVVKTPPRGVYVLSRRELVTWMAGLGPVWDPEELSQIWEAARRSTTWTR